MAKDVYLYKIRNTRTDRYVKSIRGDSTYKTINKLKSEKLKWLPEYGYDINDYVIDVFEYKTSLKARDYKEE